jgi:hypothetical protein
MRVNSERRHVTGFFVFQKRRRKPDRNPLILRTRNEQTNCVNCSENELILGHVATRRQNARHLRYTPAGSVARVSDARNTTQPPAGHTQSLVS